MPGLRRTDAPSTPPRLGSRTGGPPPTGELSMGTDACDNGRLPDPLPHGWLTARTRGVRGQQESRHRYQHLAVAGGEAARHVEEGGPRVAPYLQRMRLQRLNEPGGG